MLLRNLSGDELVSRRLTRSGKPLNENLSDDIWVVIQGGTLVPRSILKNGKRDKSYLDASRSQTLAALGPVMTNLFPPKLVPPEPIFR